ncbi:peptidase M56 BlaR1 [Desulfitobacterium hafniense DCB-2]|uniref:Peptidase M56 BlaR1 n=2 Tax=Desulfitobacterium hafniense TaxID=49338 RepID=B8FXI0_DESHD|nr:M56 family metallopeptidase [Desulfitobacterium hafniense]ACL20899.1 peptidase M56 BlaR1 [Desulfitobacterium hafniense DCB-2]
MQSFIVTLLTCSITMSAIALFYMAVTPLLAKRYSAKGRYYAWLIIVIGLIIPFRPQFDNPFVKIIPTETATPTIQIGNRTQIAGPVESALSSSDVSHILLSWWQIAAAVWLAGMIAFLVYHTVKHYRFMKMTKRWCETITDEQILSLFQNLKAELGISKQINLDQCLSIGTPMLIGFFQPKILLPTTKFPKNELRLILNHELVHYKRKDLWYRCLVLSAKAIHWFNPLVYLMAKAIDAVCEMSCDAEVVHSIDADMRQQYSEAIIGVVQYQSKVKTALSTSFYGGKKGMKERISSIMDAGKKRVGVIIACAILLLTLSTGVAFAVSSDAVEMALENESQELPTPISFVNDSPIRKDVVLLESISFELSDTNPTQTYLIAEAYEDLIFSFKGVSAPINFTLVTQNEDSHCAGFSGDTCRVYIKSESNSENVFEWSRGFIDSDSTYKPTEIVDYSSGTLEIYQVHSL